ncbi:hypothetical protein C0J45_6061 [Silurus meridionalis]|nr:hypothetical protein C0J45_6061 [Silurus meridionalis]
MTLFLPLSRGPSYQRPSQVLLANRVLVEIGLLLAKRGEGEEEDVYRDSRDGEKWRRVEVWDMMERRKGNMLCVQETRWKGSKARNIGGGFKMFYHGVDGKRNGVGVILKEEYGKRVVEVKRVFDRFMNVKADFNGHVSKGNRGDGEVMGRYGLKERNVEGQMVVDFAKRIKIVMVNTYFKRKEEHREMYKSGGRCTQILEGEKMHAEKMCRGIVVQSHH